MVNIPLSQVRFYLSVVGQFELEGSFGKGLSASASTARRRISPGSSNAIIPSANVTRTFPPKKDTSTILASSSIERSLARNIHLVRSPADNRKVSSSSKSSLNDIRESFTSNLTLKVVNCMTISSTVGHGGCFWVERAIEHRSLSTTKKTLERLVIEQKDMPCVIRLNAPSRPPLLPQDGPNLKSGS